MGKMDRSAKLLLVMAESVMDTDICRICHTSWLLFLHAVTIISLSIGFPFQKKFSIRELKNFKLLAEFEEQSRLTRQSLYAHKKFSE
jgi:hypothetical protein